jgi:hypothetical protein
MTKLSWIVVGILHFIVIFNPAEASSPDVSVVFNQNRYHVSYKTSISAPLEDVIGMLTNYDKISRVVPTVKKIHILDKNDNFDLVETHYKGCILFFCKKLINTQKITINNAVIEAISLPNNSDFKYSLMRWELKENDGVTVLNYTAEFEPKFWVPPIIGPKFLKRKLVIETQHAAKIFTN